MKVLNLFSVLLLTNIACCANIDQLDDGDRSLTAEKNLVCSVGPNWHEEIELP
jgi:hypothetical protein